GFAVVWAALDSRDKTEVAVKAFDPSRFRTASERARAAKRFRRGAAAMKNLSGCASIISIREGPYETDGILWFSMDFCGSDLAQELRRGELSTEERERIVNDLIEAVSFAHANDVLHRDIKPSNVLLQRRRGGLRAVLADFDLAFHEGALEGGQTTTAPMGS